MAGPEPSAAVVERAAQWLAHVESGDATPADLRELAAWRDADPMHALVLDRLGGIGARLGRGRSAEGETLRRLFLRRGDRRAQGAALLAVLALAGAGWLTLRSPTDQLHYAEQATRPGETRSIALPGGDAILLSSGSAAGIGEAGSRRIRLDRGELLATVAKGQPTPFVVETEEGSAQALGTAYTVRRDGAATLVTVIESHVRACPKSGERDACATLAPGQRARIAEGRVVRLADVPPADAAAWQEGWLPVDDKPLAEVLDELNRWRPQPIRYERDALAGLRVSGLFPLRETDRAVANLARLLPIAVDRRDPASPIVHRR